MDGGETLDTNYTVEAQGGHRGRVGRVDLVSGRRSVRGPGRAVLLPDRRRRAAVCAFRAERKHMNGGMFMHGGCVMTFADFALFLIARDAIEGGSSVTATFNGELVGTCADRRPGGMPRRGGEGRPQHGLRARHHRQRLGRRRADDEFLLGPEEDRPRR